MPETVFSELTSIARNGSGGSDRAPVSRPLRGLSRAKSAASRQVEGLTGGRAVQRVTDRWQFTGTDTQKRPLGREESTIAALKTLRDLEPSASHAVWNYLRMVNPGHDLRTYVFDGEGNENKEEGPAQAFLDDLVRNVGGEYGGGLDQLHNVLALGLITTGAVCAEVAPTEEIDDVIDWYPVDPTLITFRRDENDVLILGQKFRDGTFRALNANQVFYIPLDPDVDDPYGRPPLLPALGAALGKGQMINDLRAVAHNQGYPRLDVSINWKAIMEAAPTVLKQPGKELEFKEWTEGVLATVVTDYESLNVDDTFVHYDWLDIKMVGGAAGVGAFDFAALEKILTRQLNSALKTLPILLGINETTSETHGSIQWQIQVQGVAALQRLIKRVIEKLANTSLQIKGLQAHAKVEYETIRTVDRLFEAQADFFETRTVQIQELAGWRSHDEASEIITGHEAAGPIVNLKVPQPNLGTNAGGDTSQNPGTGANPEAENATQPPAAETKSPGSWGAWKLLVEPDEEAAVSRIEAANARWLAARAKRSAPQRLPRLTPTKSNELVDKYVERTRDIYEVAYEDCVRLLTNEGYDLQSSYVEPGDDWAALRNRDLAKDVADYVFGVGYSRQMKALLRDAFTEGMRIGGIEVDDIDFEMDDSLIENVWRTNRQFVLNLRDELKEALRSQQFKSLLDVRAWFDERAWREDLMGRFLAKQGIAAGYAYALSITEGRITFVWTTAGVGDTCPTCLDRSGQSFTYQELESLGFPGSIHLECGANCRCALTPE